MMAAKAFGYAPLRDRIDYAADRQWHRAPWSLHRLFFPHHTWRKWQEAAWYNVSDHTVWRKGGWRYATTQQRALDALREWCTDEIMQMPHGAPDWARPDILR